MTAEHDYHDPPPPDPLDEAYAAGWQAGAEAQRAEFIAFWDRKAAMDNAPEWAPSWVASVTSHVPLVTLPKGEG